MRPWSAPMQLVVSANAIIGLLDSQKHEKHGGEGLVDDGFMKFLGHSTRIRPYLDQLPTRLEDAIDQNPCL